MGFDPALAEPLRVIPADSQQPTVSVGPSPRLRGGPAARPDAIVAPPRARNARTALLLDSNRKPARDAMWEAVPLIPLDHALRTRMGAAVWPEIGTRVGDARRIARSAEVEIA